MRTLWMISLVALIGCNNEALIQAERDRDNALTELAALKEKVAALEAPRPQPEPISVPVAKVETIPVAPVSAPVPNVSMEEFWKKLAALKPKKSLEVGVKLTIMQVKTAREWPFDRSGYQYSYQTADKNNEYLYIDFQVTSSEEDPKLPIFVAYQVSGQKVVFLGELTVEFYRWDDYGSYLGNYHDNGNDFAKRDTVKFSAGVSVSKEALKNEAIFIGALKTPCLERSYQKFGRPEIEYSGLSCLGSVPRSATVQELTEKFEPVVLRNPSKILTP